MKRSQHSPTDRSGLNKLPVMLHGRTQFGLNDWVRPNTRWQLQFMSIYQYFVRTSIVTLLFMTGFAMNDFRAATAQDTVPKTAQRMNFALVIHGGAGRMSRDEAWQQNTRDVLNQAMLLGISQLENGGSSLDVVEAVVRILEDSEYFNAGKGAVCNAEGTHELDASIMDGRTRAAGAVGGVRTVKNPISLARRVMTETRHVLLVTDGAEKFADQFTNDPAIERVPNEYFSTPHRRQELQRIQKQGANNIPMPDDSRIGTVGCVALDRQGNLAAATSTGGLTNKKFGRLGDSPIIGAGTFADNATCAVSCTGIGEDYIRNSVAFDISARIAYKGSTLETAVHDILSNSEHQVRGGIIAIDRLGNITMQFNTEGMSRAAADSSGRREVVVRQP